jgi:hypothetical protein
MHFMLSNDILYFYYVYFVRSWEHTGILYWGSDVMAVSAVPSLTDIKTPQCFMSCHGSMFREKLHKRERARSFV